ncbi:HTH domain-containing protein [Mediannikoviicoccus vaginalis]|uniref:HTH domain-containing protein n=1 Tax=Mediannikoviicoccus vaginalis TaxID=2899727 RepID=UPI001F40A7A1|nr:HTH domain-containing protein [Mediannikoviicoccus vaginalis]
MGDPFNRSEKNVGQSETNVSQNVGQNEGQSEGQNEGQSDTQKDVNVTQNVTQKDKNVTQKDVNDTQRLKPPERRKQIIRIIENNHGITATDLSKKFNLTERTIKRDLKKLTDDKLIEYVGSSKSGYWKVKK